MAVDGVLLAGGLTLGRAGTHVPALPLLLVGHDVVILHRVQDLGPVQRGQVAQVRVLLDAHGAPRDVHEAVEAHLLQVQHLVEDQRVVEEEAVAADHRQVGEQVAQGLQAVDPEEQHILGHHLQLGEAEAPEVLRLGLEHEQDLQVALDDGAVLQGLKVGHIVSDVLTGTDWKEGGEKRSSALIIDHQALLRLLKTKQVPEKRCSRFLALRWKTVEHGV